MTQSTGIQTYHTSRSLRVQKLELLGNIQWICDKAFEKGIVPHSQYDALCTKLESFHELSMDYLYKLYEKVMSNDFTLRG